MLKFSDLKKESIAYHIANPKNSISQSARDISEANNLDYVDTFRRKLSKWLGKVDNNFDNKTITETTQYESVSSVPSAWDKGLNKFLSIEEFCDKYGLDSASVKSSKLISHNLGHMTYNIAFYTDEEEAVMDVNTHLDEIIQKYIKPTDFIVTPYILRDNDWFDRLVISDVHIGMSVQGNGDPLYDGKWDEESLMDRLFITLKHVKSYQKSTTLYIDELGDFLDGLGGQTTRKGHALPQNMNDKEAFDLSIKFKVTMIESLLEHYKHITLNNLVEDNHAGVFGYFSAAAVKGILETKYPDRVIVINRKRFIENYSVCNHTFIVCHGKDSESLKFGFKPKLDAIQAEKIDQYCKENLLYDGKFIEFSKGDSHQAIFDYTTSNDFNYCNYPAFSPPSNWVKTSFKNSKSGFVFYNINKDENIKITIPYFFK